MAKPITIAIAVSLSMVATVSINALRVKSIAKAVARAGARIRFNIVGYRNNYG
jgi:hypothetical protein